MWPFSMSLSTCNQWDLFKTQPKPPQWCFTMRTKSYTSLSPPAALGSSFTLSPGSPALDTLDFFSDPWTPHLPPPRHHLHAVLSDGTSLSSLLCLIHGHSSSSSHPSYPFLKEAGLVSWGKKVPQTGSLNNGSLLSHSSGSYGSETKVSAGTFYLRLGDQGVSPSFWGFGSEF